MMNEDDIEELYVKFLERHAGSITNFCLHASEGAADADDLIQEVFATVWVSLPGMHPGITPQQEGSWLQRVMVSVLVRHLRHRPKYITLPLGDLPEHAAEAELADRLGELTAHLPEGDQSLIQDLLDGYRMPEIAVRHGISVGAAYTRLHRIVKKLKKIQQRYDEQ